MNIEIGEIFFIMKRLFKGCLEVFFLDEEFCIIKGEKGIVLVCECLG